VVGGLFHVIRDFSICSALEAEIFGAYLHLRVLIIFLKFRLKSSSRLGDPVMDLRELTRGLL
jgi:hypothetical protein